MTTKKLTNRQKLVLDARLYYRIKMQRKGDAHLAIEAVVEKNGHAWYGNYYRNISQLALCRLIYEVSHF